METKTHFVVRNQVEVTRELCEWVPCVNSLPAVVRENGGPAINSRVEGESLGYGTGGSAVDFQSVLCSP